MTTIHYVGDEISATGWRMAGVAPIVPLPHRELESLLTALEKSDLVLIGAEVARRLPRKILSEAMARAKPLTMVIPDTRGLGADINLVAQLRAKLGGGTEDASN